MKKPTIDLGVLLRKVELEYRIKLANQIPADVKSGLKNGSIISGMEENK